MLRLLSIITIKIIILRVKSYESCDDKYCLSTIGTPENARGKCENSWILEIYDENVITLLKNLNVNTQQNGILLGMEQSRRGWMWSDGTLFVGNIDNQDGSTNVVCITNDNNSIKYLAKAIFDFAGVICSKVTTKDNCAGWFHNGLCYFKPLTTTQKWFEAHNVCIKNGASMAMFNNSETNFNKTFIDNQKYWVSLSRNTWMWTRAAVSVTFNNWLYGRPDLHSNQYCAITNSNGKEWNLVDCRGTFLIVCMKGTSQSITLPGYNSEPTTATKSSIDNPNDNREATTRSSDPTHRDIENTINSTKPTNEESLSSGAKAGIGVGVSLLVVLIVLIGVLVFKYFHQLKRKFGRKNSKKPLESENHYAEIVSGNNKSVSTNDIPGSINYADLDLQSQGTLSNNNLIQ